MKTLLETIDTSKTENVLQHHPLNNFLKSNGLKASFIAGKIGLSTGYFNNILKGVKPMSEETEQNVKKVLISLRDEIDKQIKSM